MAVNEKAKKEIIEWIEAIVIAVLLALVIKTFVIEIFQVEGHSMYPTLEDGERLVVNKFIYRFKKPQRGDIIIFKYPADPDYDYIKRVIAVENDVIEIKNGKVYLNNKLLQEDYIKEPTPGRFGPEKVPEDHFFVLGDNRNNSKDSRFPSVGFVPYENLKGKAIFVIWPLDKIGPIN